MKSRLGLIVALFFTFATSTVSSNSIECKFAYETWAGLEEAYVCRVSNVKDMDKMDEIDDFKGTHLKGKSKKDVERIMFRYGTMEKFPKGLDKVFPNLKTIAIEQVGLKEIHGDELKPFKSLEHLYLYGNKITDLEMNVFSGNPKLKHISLNGNPINFIFPDVFSNLYELEYLDLVGQTCRDIVYEVVNTPDKLEQLVSSIEVGGCLENAEDYDFVKEVFFMRINSKTVRAVVDVVRSCDKDKKALQAALNIVNGELDQCQFDKVDVESKLRTVQSKVKRLERQVSSLQSEVDECEENSQAFKKQFYDLKLKLGRESNVTGPGQADALQKLINLLEFEIETQRIIIRKCEKKVMPVYEACDEPVEIPCGANLFDDGSNRTIAQLIERNNKTSEELKTCQINLKLEIDNVFLCEKKKGETEIELKKCEMDRDDCKNKTTISIPPRFGPGACPPCKCSTCDTKNLERRYKECSDDLYTCNAEKNNFIKRITNYNITINNHDNLLESIRGQLKWCESRYAYLWESCTKGSVKPGLNPKCIKPEDYTNNPGTGTPDFVDIIVNWPDKEQCKIYGNNIQDRLDYCNKKLSTSYNFMTTYGEFFMTFPKMNYDSPPSVFGKCVEDENAAGTPFPEVGLY